MASSRLAQRSGQQELMDMEPVDFATFSQCLKHLEWLNICTLAYRPTRQWLEKTCAQNCTKAELSILDIGSGGGGMLRKIFGWTAGRKIKLLLTGIDKNPWSKMAAEASTPKSVPIRFMTADVFHLDLEEKPDFIISSLFTHHLEHGALVNFIRWMDSRATHGWFINDLHRHALAYHFIKWVTFVLPFNRLVKNDAAVSVARAFRASEWRDILAQAGIAADRISIRWHFPFRLGITCKK